MDPSSVEATNRSHTMQSIGAVLAGVLAGAIPALVTDMAMSAIGVLPHLGQPAGNAPLLLATTYRTVYGVAGAYITARLAPNRPMGHALVLGVLGFVVSIVGAVATWNRQPSLGPHWYPVALVLLAIPTAWVGGKLRVIQLGSSQTARQA